MLAKKTGQCSGMGNHRGGVVTLGQLEILSEEEPLRGEPDGEKVSDSQETSPAVMGIKRHMECLFYFLKNISFI